MKRLALATLTLICSATAASTAGASPYDTYGAGARSAAMGGAQTATASGPESLAYNVAQLALSPPRLTVGTLATFGKSTILLHDRPDGYDVPDLGSTSPGFPSADTVNPRSDTALTKPLVALAFGGVIPLLFEGLNFGFLVFLPMPTPVTFDTSFADERERYFDNQLQFERIGPKIHQLDIQVGLAYTVTDWLAVGVGAAYLPSFSVITGVYLPDATDQETTDINARIETENGWGIEAGATVTLPFDVAIGVSFRDSTALTLASNTDLQIRGVTGPETSLQQIERWTPIFTPSRVAMGAAWTLGPFRLAGDFKWTFWSDYLDSQSQLAGFRDTPSANLGTEFEYTESTRLRAGVEYEPTPVPEQTGRTNYVDSDRLAASVGAGHDLELANTPFEVAWSLRIGGHMPRRTDKAALESYPACAGDVTDLCDEVPDDTLDPHTGLEFSEARGLQTGNPGFPGFTSGGWYGVVGVEVSY